MFLNKNDGSINKFISFDPVDPPSGNSAPPKYTVMDGVFFEEKEDFDGKSYVYVGFQA